MTLASIGSVSPGAVIRGLPFLTTYNGNIYYVHSGTGVDSGKGSIERPFATIDYAIGRCLVGDTILVKPGHAETVATTIALDVGRVSIIGQGGPTQMPTLTTSAATDCISVTAANCTIANIRFAAPGIDAVTADINVAAPGCTISNTYHIGSTTALNKVDIITIAATSNDLLIDGVRIYNSVVEVVGGIVFEAAIARAEVRNCLVFDSIGFTDGCISDEAAATGLYIHHNTFKNAKAATAVVNMVSNSTGVFSYNNVSGRHTTFLSNVVTGTGIDWFLNRATEQAALNGGIAPAIDS